MNKTQQRLVILSDLWAGSQLPQWVKGYIAPLNDLFDIRYYNICELGNIDTSDAGRASTDQIDFGEAWLEKQFENGGFETAINALLMAESGRAITILAFGLGGQLAWKAALEGLDVSSMFLVCANTLKYEESKPGCPVTLYYAEYDDQKPGEFWYNRMGIKYFNILGAQQYMYSQAGFTQMLCDDLASFSYHSIDNDVSQQDTTQMNMFDKKTADMKAILAQFPIHKLD